LTVSPTIWYGVGTRASRRHRTGRSASSTRRGTEKSRGRARAHGEEQGLLGGEALHLAGVAGGGAPLKGLGRGSAAPRGVAGAAGREAHPAIAAAAEGDREERWRGRGQRHGGRHA